MDYLYEVLNFKKNLRKVFAIVWTKITNLIGCKLSHFFEINIVRVPLEKIND